MNAPGFSDEIEQCAGSAGFRASLPEREEERKEELLLSWRATRPKAHLGFVCSGSRNEEAEA